MMEALYTLAILTVVVFARYWLVRYQSTKALKMARANTINLINQCEKWLITINRMEGVGGDIQERMKRDIIRTVKKAGSDDEFYWKAFYEDFDYNKLWLDPTKWTVKQMYPKLMKYDALEGGGK